MKFGEKVRDLRKKHSLTQDELAKCLGVSKRTVIGWERDGRYPRNVEILEKMADPTEKGRTFCMDMHHIVSSKCTTKCCEKGRAYRCKSP